MEDIKQLEAKLAAAKKLQAEQAWEEYLNETEAYLKSLVGKTFMRPYQNGRFILFKVSGYDTKYYIDRNGWNGDWSPSRWFELKSTQSIDCSVKDSSGRYFRPQVKYSNLRFNKITGKSKDKIETSNLDLINYNEEKYSYLPREVKEFGKLSYEKDVPNFREDWGNFNVFLREVPEEMWLTAKKIADENIMKTKKFWDKYESLIRSL
jgi:hypothetical protein